MKETKKRPTKKQLRRRERRYMRRAVLVSTVLMAVLAFFAGRYYKNRSSILTERARAALAQGDYGEAQALLEKVVAPAGEGSDGTDTAAMAMLNESRYQNAQALLDKGLFAEAEDAFSALGEYADSREKIRECRYRAADALMQEGRYEEAADAFFALSGYADALSRYDTCRFLYAGTLENEGRLDEAFSLYRALGGYPGAEDKAADIAVRMTGTPDRELAVQLAQGYSPEEISVIERLFTARAALPEHAIAVGFYHTVGLRSDGTVVCCGRNTEKQCDTGAWTGITAVAAGAYHTAGLRSDGTVVCCGRNTEKQCETDAWTGIVAIACTDYGTVGLRSDGTVVACGFESGSGVTGWQDVKALGAGSYITVGLRNGGTLLSTHRSALVSDWTGLVQVAANTGYALALTQEGRVLFTGGGNDWSGCVRLSAGSTGFAAVTAEGKVLTHWFETRNALDLSDIENAADVAVGGTHTAVLLRDGRVVCRGSNAYGECDTDPFSLVKAS